MITCEGLCTAFRHKLTKIQVEGDSKLIINCVRNKCSIPWRLKALIKDIQMLASQFQDIQFRHIFREANFTADVIATIGHNHSSFKICEGNLPPSAHLAFIFDSSNLGCSRGFCL